MLNLVQIPVLWPDDKKEELEEELGIILPTEEDREVGSTYINVNNIEHFHAAGDGNVLLSMSNNSLFTVPLSEEEFLFMIDKAG